MFEAGANASFASAALSETVLDGRAIITVIDAPLIETQYEPLLRNPSIGRRPQHGNRSSVLTLLAGPYELEMFSFAHWY